MENGIKIGTGASSVNAARYNEEADDEQEDDTGIDEDMGEEE